MMSSFVRKAVSKKKRRYQKNGFDLDLAYITPRLIAMGFPSENMEGVYRNPFKEVFRFLELMHKDHYKVYNLCSERNYDITKFHNRVECFPFDDHNAPPLDLVFRFCVNVEEWLKADPKNVAVVHCKAGKGRTGLMICAYLLYSKEWKTPTEALDFYGAMRTHNKKGVTIPSQIRYVGYIGTVMKDFNGTLPTPTPVQLKSIVLDSVPQLSNPLDLRFAVYLYKTPVYTHKEKPIIKVGKGIGGTGPEREMLIFDNFTMPPLIADVKVEFFERTITADTKVMAVWFNTAFVNVETKTVVFLKSEIDKANKDKNKIFREDFKVEFTLHPLDKSSAFTVMTSPRSLSAASPPSTVSGGMSSKPAVISKLEASVAQDHLSKGVLNGEGQCTLTYRHACTVAEDLASQLIQSIVLSLSPSPASSTSSLRPSAPFSLSPSECQKIVENPSFKLFSLNTAELQQVQLDSLSHEEKLAFWLNTYNTLSLHSTIVFIAKSGQRDENKGTWLEAPADSASLSSWLKRASTVKYSVNRSLYCLLDIEFGVLRNKGIVPDLFAYQKFEPADERAFYSLTREEPRINFALNRASESSPRVRVYHVDKVFEELEQATRSYIQTTVTIDSAKKMVTFPQSVSFEWFAFDFARKPEKLLRSLAAYLSDSQRSALLPFFPPSSSASSSSNNSNNKNASKPEKKPNPAVILLSPSQMKFSDYSWKPMVDLTHFEMTEVK